MPPSQFVQTQTNETLTPQMARANLMVQMNAFDEWERSIDRCTKLEEENAELKRKNEELMRTLMKAFVNQQNTDIAQVEKTQEEKTQEEPEEAEEAEEAEEDFSELTEDMFPLRVRIEGCLRMMGIDNPDIVPNKRALSRYLAFILKEKANTVYSTLYKRDKKTKVLYGLNRINHGASVDEYNKAIDECKIKNLKDFYINCK